MFSVVLLQLRNPKSQMIPNPKLSEYCYHLGFECPLPPYPKGPYSKVLATVLCYWDMIET